MASVTTQLKTLVRQLRLEIIVKRNQPSLHAQLAAQTCHAVTSPRVTQASPAQLAAIIRGHWGIEDRLHRVRDMDFDEDRSQVRTASGPRTMASLVITILRLAGTTSIAAALRYHARRPSHPPQTIMKC